MGQPPSRHYRVTGVLGAGGFGTVYVAELITANGLRRDVALKVLNKDAAGSEEAARRLRDEARILSSLNHPGIVRVDDLLQLDGRWTMVMELVPGVDAEKLLTAYGPVPPSAALELVEQVARTLHAVGQATDEGQKLELVHRDIKPANILVTTLGVAKMLDFGVARARFSKREADTQNAFVMGSLAYLAPERYAFEDTVAGDVYALGATLFELLTGERFGQTRPNPAQHMEKLRTALHGAWELLVPEYREGLLQLLADCLAFEPATRPTPRQLAARIADLRRTVPGPTLADWAEDHVPPVLQQLRSQDPDSLCGAVLSDADSRISIASPQLLPPAPPEVEATKPASKGWILALVLGLTVLGLGLGAGAWALRRAPEGPAPAARPGPRHTLQDLVGGEEPEPEVAPEPAPAEPQPPRAPQKSASTAAPAKSEPTEEPEEPGDYWSAPSSAPVKELEEASPFVDPNAAPAPAGEAVILITGDADFVRLMGPEGQKAPGALPPGTYTLFPSFPGGYTVKGPTVTVQPGEKATFRCTAASKTCARE